MKKIISRQIEFKLNGYVHIVNIIKSKSRYWRLKVGKYNKQYKTYEIVLSSPKNLSDNEVFKILKNHANWLIDQVRKKDSMVRCNENEMLLHGHIVSIDEFNSHFREELKTIEERYYNLARKAHVEGIGLKFRKMKSRWGSYNKTKKIITLNSWLVILPNNLIDYVICHELSHHYVFNHSKEFYNQLGKLYTDYVGARKEIKKYSEIV